MCVCIGSCECVTTMVGVLMLVGNRDRNSALQGRGWGLGVVTDIRSFTDLGDLDPRLPGRRGSEALSDLRVLRPPLSRR